MIRLNVESLEARDVPSAVAEATVAFTPPIGSNKGSFAGDGWWNAAAAERKPAPAGICAVWHD